MGYHQYDHLIAKSNPRLTPDTPSLCSGLFLSVWNTVHLLVYLLFNPITVKIFFMQTIFNVFIEFVRFLLFFNMLVSQPQVMWSLSPWTRD